MTTAPFTVDPQELRLATQWFNDIYNMSRDRLGVSRPAYSAKETEVLEFLADLCRAEGLFVETDAGQNLLISLPEDADAERFVIVGSHVDSVPMGGNYDGMAGVLAGLMCLFRARKTGTRFARPVKVLAMRGEESAWFGPCYIASKALMGTLNGDELASAHKGDGRSLSDHMADVGIDMTRVAAGQPLMDKSDILEYIELHIEQGPLLIGKDQPAAVVSGIRGNFRHKQVRCIGEAGHSGAVPRAFRKDPVLAMADLLHRLDESWLTIVQKGDDLVLTSGVVGTDPERHAMSRIADEIRFSLDIRSQNSEVLEAMAMLLREEMDKIAAERGVTFDLGDVNNTPPALMTPELVAQLEQAMGRLGMEPTTMASGGGHDAAVFSNAGVPAAMVFVRNQNGSHNPDEAMEIEDFLAGVSIIYEYLVRTAPC
ncbi:Zn-dependent hydrolase [Neptunicoccus sediminis]|uniref:Zn-dependent hydrolase n=1 Tax=Neptunicoccus sediminis TaxID=1892596 RepID=UPI00084600FA|nr:Zn-dependent hydrolase [Neptunicoccus sediminis]